MEIISYVQAKPKSKFAFPIFDKKHFSSDKFYSKRKESAFSYNMYTPELHEFAIPKVRQQLSARALLSALGHGISVAADYVKTNIKSVLIILGITAFVGAGSYFGIKLYFHDVNHTGPVKMQQGDTLDIENLNKLMAAFALDSGAETDEDGKLLDADISKLKVNYTQPVTYQNYKVKSGDTISGIAKKFGLTNISTIISVNDIGNARTLAAGQKLKIPSMDGIIYVVKTGDTLDSIVKKYGVKLNTLLDVNELTSDTLTKGQQLFLPGVSMDQNALRDVIGTKFILPIQTKFRWTSPYGKRIDPIANVTSFHTGTDMACPTGTPIVASCSGRVSTTGTNRVYGNYVIIDHQNGYQTLYAHMSKIIATKGQWVSQGTRIGLVGSTGYSTGPHLHFTVYKNGKMVDPMTILK